MNLKQLCIDVCTEFNQLGFKKDIDPRSLKESYNISKQANGTWFKNTKQGLHDPLIKDILDLEKMPFLKHLTIIIEEKDEDLKINGGRIFITEELVYKIVKGTHIPIITNIENGPSALSGPYEKLCLELIQYGHERDRYRTEETYLLTKSTQGEWTATTSHENHSGKKIVFNIVKMPELNKFATKINKTDPSFKTNGGRIFITQNRIYKIKNKIEINLKL